MSSASPGAASSLPAGQRLRLDLKNETYRQRARDEGFRPGLAFHQYAVKNNLGAPLARSAPGSQLITVDGKTYGYQPFARDTVYSDSAQWGVVLSLHALINGKIPASGLGRALLEASYRASGGTLHPEWASHPFAVAQRLGPPLASSSSIVVAGVSYDFQVFACDTVYAPTKQPLALKRLSQTALSDPVYGPLWTATCAVSKATYDPQSPFLQTAIRLGLGAPLSAVYQAALTDGAYQIQVFACDTLYTGADKATKRLSEPPMLDFAIINTLPPPPPPTLIPPPPPAPPSMAKVPTPAAPPSTLPKGPAPATPPSPAATKSLAVVQAARKQVGKPYRTGSAGPDAFDCSGLVVWSYSQVDSTKIPHNAALLHDQCVPVDRAQIQPGDLLFFAEPPGSGRICHVGIYVGIDQGTPTMVHAPIPGRPVELVHNVFDAPWYKERVAGIGRGKR